MKALRTVPILMLALSGVLAATTGAAGTSSALALQHGGHTYNCTGGNVPPGIYRRMIITGVCYMPATAKGVTTGTFLITSGTDGPATLAGYGRFWSSDQATGTLRLVEHLRIT